MDHLARTFERLTPVLKMAFGLKILHPGRPFLHYLLHLPKRRTHSSNRHEAKGLVGNPPPRTVIGTPSQAYEQGRNCRGAFSILQSLCRTQNDAVRYNALPHEPPQGDQ